jgi:predicted dehydrogenase
VVGAGALGFHHVRLLRSQPGATLAGFYDASAEQAARVSKELGVRAFESLGALLSVVDAAVVVVPTPAHYQVAKEALQRGIHLLIEKPITRTQEEAEEVVSLAKSKGVVLQIGHVERFNRAVRAASPHIRNPLFIESERLAPYNPRGADVAVVLDLMIHDIDLVLALVRSRVQDVRAAGAGVLTGVDMTNAWMRFESGAVASIKASRLARERLRKLRIFQPGGYLSLDLAAGTGEFYELKAGLDVGACEKPAADRKARRTPQAQGTRRRAAAAGAREFRGGDRGQVARGRYRRRRSRRAWRRVAHRRRPRKEPSGAPRGAATADRCVTSCSSPGSHPATCTPPA